MTLYVNFFDNSAIALVNVDVVFFNTLNKRQYVLYYTECPSEGGIAEGGIVEGGIAGCGISLQYHRLRVLR
jgi:hypothetical protein